MATLKVAGSRDVSQGNSTEGVLWEAGYRYTGRIYRARLDAAGTSADFRTRTGFVARTGVATLRTGHSVTALWPEGSIASLSGEVVVEGVWQHAA